MQASVAAVRRRRRFAMGRSVFALMLREMATTYGRSPGGYIWAILEPVAAVGMFSIVFALFMHQPPLGNSFMLFYASGFLPLAAYQAIAANVGGAIRFSRPLLAYPTVTYTDAIVARILLALLTQVVVGVIVLSSIILLNRDPIRVDYLPLLRMIGMTVAFGTGVGLVNCFLMSMFPIWQYIWAVLNRPVFLVSGVFFLFDEMPEPAREYLGYFPVAHFISMARVAFYDDYDGTYVSETYVYGSSLVLAIFGLILLHSRHRKLLDEGN